MNTRINTRINHRMKKAAVVLATALVIGGVAGLGAVSAQGPGGPGGGPGLPGRGPALTCSTTNYTDVAAKALGMESAALRQALVSGKTLEEIAASKGVSIQTVQDALQAARDADMQQAVKDGLISQQAYDQITNPAIRPGSNSSSTPDATQQANQGGQLLPPRPNGPRGVRVPDHNIVNQLVVAAKAVGISCADLVKALQTGQSIAQVAISKNVQAQAVIDALVAADKAAIAQDVQEGLTGQAEADGQIGNVINRAGSFVYAVRQGRGPGGFPGRGPRSIGQDNGQPDGNGRGIFPPNGNGQGNPPQNGSGPGNPPQNDSSDQGTAQPRQNS